MFGDDVLTFDVVEAPVPRARWNGFHTKHKKIKIVQFWYEAKSYVTAAAESFGSLNSCHVMHPAASSS